MSAGGSGPYRVALVAAGGFPSSRGSHVLLAGLANLLLRRGHEVHAVVHAGSDPGIQPPAGLAIHRSRGLRWRAPAGQPGPRRLAEDGFLARTLLQVVRRCHIDVMHAHNYEGAIVAAAVRRWTGVPMVYHAHNVLADELPFYAKTRLAKRLARRAGRWLDRWVPCQADFTIALTAEVADYLRPFSVAPQRLRVLTPHIEPSEDQGAQLPASPWPGRFVVLYCGNLDAYQDLDVLADGFERFLEHADALLVIVTHERNWRGRLGAKLSDLVGRGAARVVVAGNAGEAQGHVRWADVVVSPRSSWSGYPMKLLNYLAAGKAIVAASGSAKDLEHERNALIFPDRDPMRLSQMLLRLRSEEALRARLAEAALETSRRLTDSAAAAAEIESIYATVQRNGRKLEAR